MKKELYFDNNATTKPIPQVRKAIMEILGSSFGNPSSAHSSGERARKMIFSARESIAKLIGAEPEQILFLSGATEANNMVLSSVVNRDAQRSNIITTNIEHSSIVKCCIHLEDKGVKITRLSVDRLGHINLETLEAAIKPETSLISIQWVNNETGVINDIEKISAICSKKGILFHSDAAQAVGKITIDVSRIPVDFLSISGHKFHGPQGIGALYAKEFKLLRPIIYGGVQEHGLRAGTENMPGIVGIGKAAEHRTQNFIEIQKHIRSLRDHFESKILNLIPHTYINGDSNNRAPNTTNILFKGIDGQALVAQLDNHGIRCSQSSACTNRIPEPSYVLRAMGLSNDDAYSSIRFSFSELNNIDEIDWAIKRIVAICKKLTSKKYK